MTNSHLLRIVIVITLLNLAGLVNMQLAMSDVRALRSEYITQSKQRDEALTIMRNFTTCEKQQASIIVEKEHLNEVAGRGE